MNNARPLDLVMSSRAGWRSSRLKDVASYVGRGISPSYADAETGVVAFSQKCIRSDLSVAPELGRPIVLDESTAGASRLHQGDVVLNSTGRGTLGRASMISAEPEVVLVADGHVTVIRVDRSCADPGFVRWLLATRGFYEQANECLALGATNQTELNRDTLRSMVVTLPVLDEQRRISRFLDREVFQIRSLISDHEGLGRLLVERRSTAVFDAVTGRSMAGGRRAGVPWVDSIPEGWGAVKLTALASLGSGHTPARNRPELWMECTIPWITTGEVWQIRSDEQEVITDTREMISEAGVVNSAAMVHPAGTVVLCRTAASAGYSALMGADMATSQDFATWTCGPDLDPNFLLYCLRAMRRDLLERLAMGSTHRTIYMPEIKSIMVPLPPIDEQRRIVADLRAELTRLDEVRLELGRQIELLQEHRQALITAAVTEGIDALPGVA